MKLFLFLAPILLATAAFGAKEDKAVTRSEGFDNFVASINGNRDEVYGVFAIKDQEIVVESTGARDATYEDFTAALRKSGECRYGVFAYSCKGSTKVQDSKRKLVAVVYAPDTVPSKKKQPYVYSKDTFRKGVMNTAAEILATENSDLKREAVEKKVC